MFHSQQSSAVDAGRYVAGDVDEEDVCDVVRRASPPFATRQHVAVNDNVRRTDVLVHAEETQVMEKSHIFVITAVVWTKRDVVHDVRYHEALCITSILRLIRHFTLRFVTVKNHGRRSSLARFIHCINSLDFFLDFCYIKC